MKKNLLFLLFTSFGFSFIASAQNTENTRMLYQPAISKSKIAFIYAEDLWVANKDGSYPRRLTVDEGVESSPVFSPDGNTIAFSAQYDGNRDVYIIPAAGGIPKRLTWHPGPDIVRDFTPDGKNVLFLSGRNSFTNRFAQLYTVNIANGNELQLPIPSANWATYNSDGSYLAYTPLQDRFDQWKHYRGGTATRIWLYNTKTHAVEEIAKPAGGSNDSRPVWRGNKIYFRSDRDGEFNLYSYDVTTKQTEKLTNYTDFPVSTMGASNDEIIFDQAGYLNLFSMATGKVTPLKVGIATDLPEKRERFVSAESYIRDADISPTGTRAVFDYRGEIITLPAQKGDALNLTNTPGVHEKNPAWSPNGRSIAYFSDESGEYALHIIAQDGLGATRKIALSGSGFYSNIHWSPDSKKLCFVDNGRKLYWADMATGKVTLVGEDVNYVPGPYRDLFGSWSGDGNYLTYTIITATNFEQAFVYSVAENKSIPLSDGFSSVSEPVFDPGGKYIYMLASTDAGPVVNWFDQSSQDMQETNTLYLVTLQKSTESPFNKENEMEAVSDSAKESTSAGDKKTVAKAAAPKPSFKIDWDGLQGRIVAFPIASGRYRSISVPKEGEIYYISEKPNSAEPPNLQKYDLKKKKEETIMPADNFRVSAKGDKMIYILKNKWGIVGTGQKPTPESALKTSDIQVKINPPKEWINIFNEAWRVNRDYFYDKNMHGVNWAAMRTKYEAFLPDLSAKSDLYRVMQWMFSELGVGHHNLSPGDQRTNSKVVPGGLLGADYEEASGKYRIKKIYGGLNWNPGLRSPLTEPGVDVKVGDYILEVNGKAVNTDNNFYSYFENTADKITNLLVSANADGRNARTVKVVPVANESALRNRDWVEGNIRKVNAATNGQVAYVYVPNTATQGHEYFKRYFFPQANKKAIIIDERFNGGGQLADYYIDILKRPLQSYWNLRYGRDQKAPLASIQGPKVMLIDETAGSGGDYLPYLFRQAKLGTLVGKRTWGGLVGILGFPEFIDGGTVTAPNLAFYDEKGFGIENVGTPPDVEVEQWPADVIKGRDPQLEKAIEIALKQLKENPPVEMKTPVYPKVVKN